MKPLNKMIWLMMALLVMAPVAAATDDTCSQIVRAALEATDQVCNDTGRNQACYGHILLEAQPQPGFGPFVFNQAGDRVDVATLKSLRLSAMDVGTGAWGVALMRLQANLPDTQPGHNATVLLFGDVQVENAVEAPTLVDVWVASSSAINVRRTPKKDGFVVATLPSGQRVTARGRLADNSWLYIELPDGSGNGWVRGRLMGNWSDFEKLKVVDPALVQYGPMQAFYLKTGVNGDPAGQPACGEAPDDGIMIQTPEGVAEVRLWINEVKIRLGSTAFIQAQPGKQLKVATLEGKARVEAMGVEMVAPAGTELSVPLNENAAPAAPPSKPKPYDQASLQTLPVQGLDREVTVAPPLTEEEIEQALIEDAIEQAAMAEVTEEPVVEEVTEEPLYDEETEEPLTSEVTEGATSEATGEVTEAATAPASTEPPATSEITEEAATPAPTESPTGSEMTEDPLLPSDTPWTFCGLNPSPPCQSETPTNQPTAGDTATPESTAEGG